MSSIISFDCSDEDSEYFVITATVVPHRPASGTAPLPEAAKCLILRIDKKMQDNI